MPSRLALPYLDPPGERVEIPYEGTRFYGILRKPAGVAKPPIVVMCMGLDSAKEEMDAYESIFLARGMATLAFEARGRVEFLLIEDGNHVANNRGYRYRTQSADWMAHELGLALR